MVNTYSPIHVYHQRKTISLCHFYHLMPPILTKEMYLNSLAQRNPPCQLERKGYIIVLKPVEWGASTVAYILKVKSDCK